MAKKKVKDEAEQTAVPSRPSDEEIIKGGKWVSKNEASGMGVIDHPKFGYVKVALPGK